MKNFSDYCGDHRDYPSEDIASEGFGPGDHGCWYSYVSSTFLSGFLNYPKIQRAVLLDRYEKREDNDEAITNFYVSLEAKNKRGHTNIAELFEDDVIILSHGEPNTWWLFWCDRDSSDCEVAVFKTDAPADEVIASFEAWLKGLEYPSRPLDPQAFRGWITY